MIQGNDACEINIDGLERLMKAFKVDLPEGKIGILGDHNSRAGESTNASIGAVHEFGNSEHPQRSFLRVPLSDRLNKELEKAGVLDDEALLKECIKTSSLKPILKKVAIVAEGIVLGAFDTGGYGKWPAWKNPNYKNNANMLLVDTTQLRDSITTEVE